MAWYKVASVQESPAHLQSVKAGGKKLCLIYNQQQYFATQLYCPHAGANLSEGWCAEGKLVCPYHRYTYDLLTGKGGDRQGDYVETYKVKIKDGQILVQVNTLMERIKSLFSNKEDR